MPIHEIIFDAEAGGAKVPPPQALQHYGPTIEVIVAKFSPKGAPKSDVPAPVHSFALIDTGATMSCIDEKLAQQLMLPVVDRREVGGVAGRTMHNVYLAHMIVPPLRIESKDAFLGVDLSSYQPVLLGRDFLMNTVFTYSGPFGRISLAV